MMMSQAGYKGAHSCIKYHTNSSLWCLTSNSVETSLDEQRTVTVKDEEECCN